MAQFSIILEDVSLYSGSGSGSGGGGRHAVISNRRTEMVEADSLEAAWLLARQRYYFHRVSGEIQIVDVVAA
jgi:hypothetical protein